MKETSFHHIELRDKVWDLLLGWGEVSRIDRYRNEITSFKVLFHKEGRPGEITYNPDGYEFAHSYEARRLFWDELTYPAPPPKPKRKVKKLLWVNVYRYGPDVFTVGTVHSDELNARDIKDHPNYFTTKSIEIEVEE